MIILRNNIIKVKKESLKDPTYFLQWSDSILFAPFIVPVLLVKTSFVISPKKDKDVMDLYKELPSTKLQVLLVTEISNTLQIKKK